MQITIDTKPKKVEKCPQEWIEYKDGFKVLIAGEARPSYQYAYQLAVAEENAIRTQGAITDEYVSTLDEKYAGVIGRYLILGWDGAEIGDWSPDQAELVCKYGKTKEDANFGSNLAIWVQKRAAEIQKRANALKVEAVGKSQNTTGGQINSQDSANSKSKDAGKSVGKSKNQKTA